MQTDDSDDDILIIIKGEALIHVEGPVSGSFTKAGAFRTASAEVDSTLCFLPIIHTNLYS